MPTPTPEGAHTFSIYSWTDEVSKAGNPMWKIELQHTEHPEEYWRIRYYIVQNNKMTRVNLDEIMTSIGKPLAEVDKISPLEYIGDIVEIEVEHEEFDNNTYAKAVKFIKNDGETENIGNQEPVSSVPAPTAEDSEVPF